MGIPGSTCATKSSTATNDEDGKSGGSGKHSSPPAQPQMKMKGRGSGKHSRNDERMKDLRKHHFSGEFSDHEKGTQNLQKLTNLSAPPSG